MTEDQIERMVERRMDRLDAIYLSSHSGMTEQEYNAGCKAIDDWAKAQYTQSTN